MGKGEITPMLQRRPWNREVKGPPPSGPAQNPSQKSSSPKMPPYLAPCQALSLSHQTFTNVLNLSTSIQVHSHDSAPVPSDRSPRCCSTLHLEARLCPPPLHTAARTTFLKYKSICTTPLLKTLHGSPSSSRCSPNSLPTYESPWDPSSLLWAVLTEKDTEGQSDWVLLYACLMLKYYHPGYSSPKAPAHSNL